MQRREQDLREVGYLRAAIPEERGGLSLTLAEVDLEQRRLAYRAPAPSTLMTSLCRTVPDFIGRSVLGLL